MNKRKKLWDANKPVPAYIGRVFREKENPQINNAPIKKISNDYREKLVAALNEVKCIDQMINEVWVRSGYLLDFDEGVSYFSKMNNKIYTVDEVIEEINAKNEDVIFLDNNLKNVEIIIAESNAKVEVSKEDEVNGVIETVRKRLGVDLDQKTASTLVNFNISKDLIAQGLLDGLFRK